MCTHQKLVCGHMTKGGIYRFGPAPIKISTTFFTELGEKFTRKGRQIADTITSRRGMPEASPYLIPDL